MMRFEIHGEFGAEDLDDAFERLAEHFAGIVAQLDDDDAPTVFALGAPYELHVSPLAKPGVP